MEFKAGKDFDKTIFVDLGGDRYVPLAKILDDDGYIPIWNFKIMMAYSYDLAVKDGDGGFKYLDNKQDIKFDLRDTQIGLEGTFGSGDEFVLTGARGCDIELGEGRNVFRGGGGRDRVEGGSEADVISGGRGNDIIRGGGGNDVLSGGKGNDLFIFNHSDAFKARVTDFKVGEDLMVLEGWSKDDIKIKNTDEGAIIRHSGDKDRVLMEGVSKQELSDFDDWLF